MAVEGLHRRKLILLTFLSTLKINLSQECKTRTQHWWLRLLPSSFSSPLPAAQQLPLACMFLPAAVPVAPRCIWSLQTPCEPPVLLTCPGLMTSAEPGRQTHTQDTRKDRNISNNYKTFPRDTKNWIMVLTSHKNQLWGLKTQSSTRIKLIQYQLGINLTYCTITSKFNAQHLNKVIQIDNMQVSWAFVADARD